MGRLERLNMVSICLFNLFVVSLLGLLMRYKIGFEFPYLDQRNLQHAHSHFAFAGWVSLLLMVLIVKTIKARSAINTMYFNVLLLANLLCAYGILISFMLQGYKFWAIFFLVTSIVISFAFSIEYLRKTYKQAAFESNRWFLAALFFNFISTFGTFYLSYMMASHTLNQEHYLTSIYWYLHFQYNGWFFFTCVGLLIDYLVRQRFNIVSIRSVFWIFFLSCIPAFGLSVLWLNVPTWVYAIIVIASFVQLFAWVKLFYILKKSVFIQAFPILMKYLFVCLGISFSLKFLLQSASIIPFISHLAFGFRPVVIAYLHLVLLVCISIFLIAFVYVNKYILITKRLQVGLVILFLGIYINEVLLGVQGVCSLNYTLIPYINELLFGISVVISIGLLIVNFSFFQKLEKSQTI